MTRAVDRLCWLAWLAAVAYILAHVYLDMIATTYEDGSAIYPLGPITLVRDAGDSTGDGWHLR